MILTSVFSGDKLQCYLPPRREATQQLHPEFERVFIEDCDKLFADSDTREYRQSQVSSIRWIFDSINIQTIKIQVRKLTYTYTCPATVLHACHVSGLGSSLVTSLVIHVVGARTAEVEEAASWTLIAANLPHLKKCV